MKKEIVIAGIGSIDECDHCRKQHILGNACFVVDEWVSINLCDECVKKYKIKTHGNKWN